MTEDEEELLRSVALQNAAAVLAARDRTERELIEAKERAEKLAADLGDALRGANLAAAVSQTMVSTESLDEMLASCVAAMVTHADAALARIWTTNTDGTVLKLRASAGLYTHLDGPHGKVPVGQFKIGRIARDHAPHTTNDVQHDPHVSDQPWTVRENLVSFAGYPLLVQGRTVGVVAMFARRPLGEDILRALSSVADVLALGVQRMRADTRRQRAEAELAATLRSIGDAVIATDTRACITFMNSVAETLTGWPLSDAIGQPLANIFRIINEHSRKEVESPADRVLREGVVVGLANHTILLARNGAQVPIDDSGAPIRDSHGALVGVVLVFRDVGKQKLDADRKEFLADATPALAAVLDVRETLANLARLAVPKLADWCAVDLPSSDGQSVERVALVHVDASKIALAHELQRQFPASPNEASGVHHVLRTGESVLYSQITDDQLAANAVNDEHLRILRALGLRSVMMVALRVRQRTLGAITFVNSESERSYTADDLAFAEELARRAAIAVDNAQLYESEQSARRNADLANRAKDDFLATVSHELRSPLNAMLGWTRMLRAGQLTGETQTRALETIERNAVAQAQLIEDLLDVSRIVSGNLRLDVESVELTHIVQHAIESLRLASEAKNVGIITTLESNAGSIMGDPQRLQQVVWNLLSNAIKFTPKGGRIYVKVEHIDSNLKLSVTDTGRGINPEFLPHVFERFKQAEGATTRSFGGLGLGLAISRHIVELHGGTIEVESKGEGLGSTFTVVVPIAPVRVSDGGSDEAAPPTFETRKELHKLKVLVVDDEEDARDLLVTILEKCGAVVTTASNAGEALAEIQSAHPDILVSDIGMPHENGYSLIRKVRELPGADADIPAVALTAYARAEDRRKALDAGFMMHVPKPVEPAELIAVIASLTRFNARRS